MAQFLTFNGSEFANVGLNTPRILNRTISTLGDQLPKCLANGLATNNNVNYPDYWNGGHFTQVGFLVYANVTSADDSSNQWVILKDGDGNLAGNVRFQDGGYLSPLCTCLTLLFAKERWREAWN